MRKRGDAICVAVISLIGHRDARADVRADVERYLKLRAVARLASGQVEVERTAVEIGLEVMVWTAPNGIDCARLRPLQLSDQGDRPWTRLAELVWIHQSTFFSFMV